MTTLISRFRPNDGGGVITFPFILSPRQVDDVIADLKPNVYFLQRGQDGAPWTGYYTTYKDIKYAIENYDGVWFIIAYDRNDKLHKATRMAPAELNLIHYPSTRLNIEDLRAQTLKNGVPNLDQPDPPPLTLARTIAGPSHTRPLSAALNHSNQSVHSN